MPNRYLVVSDLHLADIEDHPDGWKFYKASRFVADGEIDALVGRFMEQSPTGSRLTLILNGDVFDFDLVTAVPDDPPWPITPSERSRGLDATESKSVWKLERMLAQHPIFVDTMARFVAAGHTLVYVMGNHDREFHFAGVQSAFVEAIQRRIESVASEFDDRQIRFEPWFYLVEGEIYAEHGQQYDHYTSFRHLLAPTIFQRKQERIALPMGNLSNRLLMSKMGFFNPHSGEFILNVFSYLVHWLKKYAFTRRSLAINWLWGSLVVMARLVRTRRWFRWHPSDLDDQLDRVAGRFGLERAVVKALYRLQRPPITSMFYRIVREFWLDRVLIAAVMTIGTIILALSGAPLWVKLMVPLTAFPLIYFIYEYLARGEDIFTIEKRFPEVARAISHLVEVKVVVLGHTHVPRLIPLSKEVSFVDSGTWAPVTTRQNPEVLEPGLRNYLILSFENGRPCVTFDSWMNKELSRSKALRKLASGEIRASG